MPHPYTPLTDAEFALLLPFLHGRSPRGRQVGDLRARLDGIFYLSSTIDPWRTLPERYGKPDTVSRWFRRLTATGFWSTLVERLARAPRRDPIHALRYRLCRACRRAARLLGLRFNARLRQLGLAEALPGPPWMVCNPNLSETIHAVCPPRTDSWLALGLAAMQARARLLRTLHRAAAGRSRIPRALRLGWS
jgi:transposase